MKNSEMRDVSTYHDRLIDVVNSNRHRIDEGIDVLVEEIISRGRHKRNVWLIGNGGSASTAEHFETDLAFIRHNNLRELPAITAITSNSALVTATSNDISYDDIFRILLERKANEGDLLVVISASGNSKNLINAIHYSKKLGIATFSLLGFDGGKAKEISDNSLVVLSNIGEYGIVEDIHLSICHATSAKILSKLMSSS
jgi:D-sedoheptulose 7-phosphate isomerase